MNDPIKHQEVEQIHRDDLAEAVKKTKKTRRTKTVIEACRKVVAEHQATRFRGVLLDAYSASAVVNIYNAISEDNKVKYEAMDKGDATSLLRMVDVAFKMHKK